jgi:NADH-quinone oxidoreductase subunit B
VASVDLPVPFPRTVDVGTRYALSVHSLGLACCAVELVAATFGGGEPQLPGAGEPVAVLVVAGTVTDAMAGAVRRLYDQLPEPRYVVSFGACSNSGGPYWDSYAVTKGVDQLIPVDVYVPGCPPRPEALIDGLRALAARIQGEQIDAGRVDA